MANRAPLPRLHARPTSCPSPPTSRSTSRPTARHLRWLADAPGVTGIVANGHAAEVSSLTREERKRALAIALDEVAGKVPVVAGVYSDGTREAVELARDARAAGAAGLLVFPPTLFMWGAQLKPDMVLRHFSELADGVDLPLVVFEYPPASGIGYSPETLAALCKIPSVVAVKDWSNDIVAYEKNLRALRASGRPVAMLSSFTMSLMASFVLGADGCISGMGSVAADLQAALLAAVQARAARRGARDQRPAGAARRRLLRAALRGHAQPHEGGPRAPRPHPRRARAAAAHARSPTTSAHRIRLALREAAAQHGGRGAVTPAERGRRIGRYAAGPARLRAALRPCRAAGAALAAGAGRVVGARGDPPLRRQREQCAHAPALRPRRAGSADRGL